MREQLAALEELARIDQGRRQLDVELEEINSRLAELRSDVDKIRALLEREKAQLAEGETLRTQTVQEVEDLADRLARSQKRQQTAKNNREMEAMTRELEVLRREREERTAKVTELEGVVSQVRESITRHEADFAKLQEVLETEERESKVRAEEIQGRRNEHEKSRSGVASKVRADLLRKYNVISERRTTAVAELSGGICRGCHIVLPPQFANQVYAAKQIFQCPNCQRILVYRSQNPAAT